MKRTRVIILVVFIPVLLFLSVWQSYRYDKLSSEVMHLEQNQKELFEKNKKIVMAIEFLKSPFRIDKIADEELDLKKIEPGKIIRIQIAPKEGRLDG